MTRHDCDDRSRRIGISVVDKVEEKKSIIDDQALGSHCLLSYCQSEQNKALHSHMKVTYSDDFTIALSPSYCFETHFARSYLHIATSSLSHFVTCNIVEKGAREIAHSYIRWYINGAE